MNYRICLVFQEAQVSLVLHCRFLLLMGDFIPGAKLRMKSLFLHYHLYDSNP